MLSNQIARCEGVAQGLASKHILSELQENGYTGYTGVPCSLLKGLFKQLEGEAYQPKKAGSGCPVYIPANREDSAMGLAAGMHLAGRKSVVLMQNSGLGYSMNVLTSLLAIYQIPILLIISWRGAYGNDAVEHDLIGERLPHVLDSIKVPYVEYDGQQGTASVTRCMALVEQSGMPAALLIKDEI